MKDERGQLNLETRFRKFMDRKQIAMKQEDPYLVQVNGKELYPIFADVRNHILVTGQTYSYAPGYGIDLTKHLILKKHIIHASTTYSGARSIWLLLFHFGFVTDKTAERHNAHCGYKKNKPHFSFHLFHEKHHVIEDTVNNGNLTNLDIDDDAPVDVIYYLNEHAHESFADILSSNKPLGEMVSDLNEIRPTLITKLVLHYFDESLPHPTELPSGFNHIIVTKNASHVALDYKNRLHLRDTRESFKIYFPDQEQNPGWRLHRCSLGQWYIITPDADPVIQRVAVEQTRCGFHWYPADGQ
jgi:hypothetical protein